MGLRLATDARNSSLPRADCEWSSLPPADDSQQALPPRRHRSRGLALTQPPDRFPAARWRRVSFRRRADRQPVAVRVAQLNLMRPRSVRRLHTELGGYGLDIPNAEVHQCVGTGITVVLRQEQPHPAPGDLDERRKSRLEAVFPLLGEAQPLVPRDRRSSILDVKGLTSSSMLSWSQTAEATLPDAALVLHPSHDSPGVTAASRTKPSSMSTPNGRASTPRHLIICHDRERTRDVAPPRCGPRRLP